MKLEGDVQIRFKWLVEDVDRFSNIRVYVRVPGRRKVRIREKFGTDDFIAAYNAAVSDHVATPRQAREIKPGSLRALCVLYYGSALFKRARSGHSIVAPNCPRSLSRCTNVFFGTRRAPKTSPD